MPTQKKTKKDQSVTKKDIKDLHELMAKNLYHTQKIERLAKKFDKFIFWIKVQTVVKVFLIVVPIVLAYFFVIPKVQVYFNEITQLYKSLIP